MVQLVLRVGRIETYVYRSRYFPSYPVFFRVSSFCDLYAPKPKVFLEVLGGENSERSVDRGQCECGGSARLGRRVPSHHLFEHIP